MREGFDCVLRVGVRGDSSLIARTIGHYRLVNCVSRGYIQQHGSPQSLDELSEHQLVHYVSTLGNAVDGFEYVDQQTGEARTIAMRGLITVNNSSAYLAACQAGLGIIQIPIVAVRVQLERGELIEVLPDCCPAPMPVSLLYPNRHLPRRTRVFMDWMATLLQPLLQERG